MSTTVHVAGIAAGTSEQEVRDFFSFCGKIVNLSITPTSDAATSPKSATVTFEKETAAKTALLLDNTELGKSQVHVTAAHTIDDVATKAGAPVSSSLLDDHIAQEDKPRGRIAAEYLAHGYSLSDQVLQKALDLDKKHGFSTKFTQALTDFDQKYKASEKARTVDNRYGVTERTQGALANLNSYFEKALNTPTGQRLRSFYVEGDKQVRDVHNEARRLADIKAGKAHEHEPVEASYQSHAVESKSGPAQGADTTVPAATGAKEAA
ncbi:hypothetical protein DV736_g6312, partial [Chaetothyriales sp. CBS 134916]